MKIRPLQDYVLVHRRKPTEKSPGGIIIPDSAQERAQEGEVLAVGPGRFTEHGVHIAMQVRVGEVVLFGKYVEASNVAPTSSDPEAPVLIRESALLAVRSY